MLSLIIHIQPCKWHVFLLPTVYTLVGLNFWFLPESQLWGGKTDHSGSLRGLAMGNKTKKWQCNPSKNVLYRLDFAPAWLWKELSEELQILWLRWVAGAYPKSNHSQACYSDSLSITRKILQEKSLDVCIKKYIWVCVLRLSRVHITLRLRVFLD